MEIVHNKRLTLYQRENSLAFVLILGHVPLALEFAIHADLKDACFHSLSNSTQLSV